jgi:hypothetical protein
VALLVAAMVENKMFKLVCKLPEAKQLELLDLVELKDRSAYVLNYNNRLLLFV